MNKIKPLILFAVFFSVVLISFPRINDVAAEQSTLVVPDDYGSIQEAIDAAVAGDVVYVRSGAYHENLVITKSLSLIGENVDTTIVDGNPSEGYRIPIKIQGDNVSVSGFKVLYGYSGISVGSSKYCNISANRIAANQHGVMLLSSSHCVVSKNYFEQIGLSSAIQLSNSNSSMLTGNYITNCTDGIQLRLGSSDNLVTENTVTNCDRVAFRLLGGYSPPRYYEPNNNIVTRNVFSYSGVGATIYRANNNTLCNNSFINNTNQISTNEWYEQQWGYRFSNNTINQNYWSNYNGTDSKNDGLGDTPFIIDENNQDNNPILTPITVEEIPEFASWIFLVFFASTFCVMAYKRKLFNYG